MFPLSEVVLMIPRCVALSTDGILLGLIVANGKGQVVVFLFTLFVGDV